MKKTLIVGLSLLLPLAMGGVAGAMADTAAQHEHPEDEAEGQEQEHPEDAEKTEDESAEGDEHPEEAEVEELTVDQLADAIVAWVEEESAANGGTLPIQNPDTGEMLHLTLEKVHRERLSRVGEQTYFACADFRGQDGTLYDLDVFMQGPNQESLETTEVTLHKVNGEARYTWYEEDGVWKKQPIS